MNLRNLFSLHLPKGSKGRLETKGYRLVLLLNYCFEPLCLFTSLHITWTFVSVALLLMFCRSLLIEMCNSLVWVLFFK